MKYSWFNKLHFTERGNGPLELALFSPIAFLFLFVATDCGLFFLDRGVITDALREGLHQQALGEGESGVLLRQADGEISVDETTAAALARRIGDRIAQNLLQARSGLSSANTDFRVSVRPVVLEFSEKDGELQDYQLLAPQFSSLGSNYLDVSKEAVARYEAPDKFIERVLEAEKSKSLSRYAPVAGFSFEQSQVERRYLSRTVLFHAEVTALSPGINRYFTKAVLNRHFAVQEQQLESLRLELGDPL